MLRRAAYQAEAMLASSALRAFPHGLFPRVVVHHASTTLHLSRFLEGVLTQAPRTEISIASWMPETDIRAEYPDLDLLQSRHRVEFGDSPAPLAVLLYSHPLRHRADGRLTEIMRGFRRSASPQKIIIHSDGSMWRGELLPRLSRRILNPAYAFLAPRRDALERRLLDAALSSDAHVLIDFPIRIERDPRTGNLVKPQLLAEGPPPGIYEADYHDSPFHDAPMDWPAATRAYQEQRWSNLQSLGYAGSPGSALDIGCGTGAFAALLAGKGFRVLGTDVSETSIAQAHATFPGVQFAVRPLEEIGGGGERYDLVVLCHVLEHARDDSALLRAAAGLLTPGGCLYVEVPLASRDALALRPGWHRQVDHYREYTWDGLEKTALGAGLAIICHRDSIAPRAGGEPHHFLIAQPAPDGHSP